MVPDKLSATAKLEFDEVEQLLDEHKLTADQVSFSIKTTRERTRALRCFGELAEIAEAYANRRVPDQQSLPGVDEVDERAALLVRFLELRGRTRAAARLAWNLDVEVCLYDSFTGEIVDHSEMLRRTERRRRAKTEAGPAVETTVEPSETITEPRLQLGHEVIDAELCDDGKDEDDDAAPIYHADSCLDPDCDGSCIARERRSDDACDDGDPCTDNDCKDDAAPNPRTVTLDGNVGTFEHFIDGNPCTDDDCKTCAMAMNACFDRDAEADPDELRPLPDGCREQECRKCGTVFDLPADDTTTLCRACSPLPGVPAPAPTRRRRRAP